MLLTRDESASADPPDTTAADAELLDRFRAAVAVAGLQRWLPPTPQIILDLSPGCPRLLDAMVATGHTVVHATPSPEPTAPVCTGDGLLRRVRADTRALDWVADEAVDLVVAEGGCLSAAPAAEFTLDDVHRVLRPGGRVLLTVDSLVSGLSRLAGQGRWAELADVPAADVVLVPCADGSVSRCFWPEELHDIVTAAGFGVDWIRPRTVLADETVVRALRLDADQLPTLVRTELGLAERRAGDATGAQLVVSAHRR